jgi:hypothetical protein
MDSDAACRQCRPCHRAAIVKPATTGDAPEPFRVRQAAAADCNEIAALHIANMQETYASFLSADYLTKTMPAERRARWASRFGVGQTSQHLTLVAEGQSGTLAGFVCLVLDLTDRWVSSLIACTLIRPAADKDWAGICCDRQSPNSRPCTRPGRCIFWYTRRTLTPAVCMTRSRAKLSSACQGIPAGAAQLFSFAITGLPQAVWGMLCADISGRSGESGADGGVDPS